MTWIVVALLVVLGLWASSRFYLEGEDLARYDVPRPDPVNDAPSAANQEVVALVRSLADEAAAAARRARLTLIRNRLDQLGQDADTSGIEVTPVTVAGRPAEWLTQHGREPRGRLLYLHGGGFAAGSPLSHRRITAQLARRTGLAILALDYRLMPEHSRRAMLDDCWNAYRWMSANGPEGPGAPEAVFVAGDSAGGNLTLSLIARIRDAQAWDQSPDRDGRANSVRPADGAIALSPLTDATFASPSLAGNIDTDPMLGAMAKWIGRAPRALLQWSTWLQNRLRPCDPRLSPVRGDLSRLPPVLVLASEAEILIDDARRYVNKARDAGSPAEIATWRGMVHVWPAFGPDLPETRQAFELIEAFVERVLQSRGQADAA